MKQYHGKHKKHSFFEGWYLKHQNQNNTLSVIPSIHIDSQGKSFASLQIITNNDAYAFTYPAETFYASTKKFYVKLNKNIFCEKGISLSIHEKDFSLTGKLYYTPWTPLSYSIMGPFAPLSSILQCNHGVLSLSHHLTGTLVLNGSAISFTGGTGYIEKDWGSSFPQSYLWTQCNQFHHRNSCIMLSVAVIPLLGLHFTGCICCIYYKGTEYRFATYLGVKILLFTEKQVILQQNGYVLEVTLLEENSHSLQAPELGAMSRTIHESPSCKVRYLFYRKTEVIFDFISNQASFESAL